MMGATRSVQTMVRAIDELNNLKDYLRGIELAVGGVAEIELQDETAFRAMLMRAFDDVEAICGRLTEEHVAQQADMKAAQ
jgi:hypothetical protein